MILTHHNINAKNATFVHKRSIESYLFEDSKDARTQIKQNMTLVSRLPKKCT